MAEDTGPAADRREDDERRETLAAQEAHGGSMAPGLVDPTGHPLPDAERQIADQGELADPAADEQPR